jgi:sn-glycerol 3-phosphate transport system substrate-binding protein
MLRDEPSREDTMSMGIARKRGSRSGRARGIIACAAGAILLAVCFSHPGIAAAGKIEIEFWHSLGYQAKGLVDAMVQEYNRTHPGVSVKAVFQGQYEEMEIKVLAAAAGRRLPAVIQEQFEFMGKYIEEGILIPVDDLVGKADREDIPDLFWDLVSVDDPRTGKELASRGGRIYGVPICVSTTVLFYNKDLFKESGLDPSKPPGTWVDLIAMGKRIVARGRGSGVYGYSFWRNGFYGWAPLLWGNGGDLFSKGDENGFRLSTNQAVRTVTMLRDLVFTHGIMPRNWTDAETGQAFLQGTVAMGPFTCAGLKYGKDNLPWELGVAPLPALSEKRYTVLAGSALLNFARSRSERAAAGDFMLWLVSRDNTIRLHEGIGYIPVRKSALESLELKAFHKENPDFRVAITTLPDARPLPYHKEYFKINKILTQMMDRVFISGGDPAAELKWAEDEIGKIVD